MTKPTEDARGVEPVQQAEIHELCAEILIPAEGRVGGMGETTFQRQAKVVADPPNKRGRRAILV